MVFGNGVKNIQATAYNDARMMILYQVCFYSVAQICAYTFRGR